MSHIFTATILLKKVARVIFHIKIPFLAFPMLGTELTHWKSFWLPGWGSVYNTPAGGESDVHPASGRVADAEGRRQEAEGRMHKTGDGRRKTEDGRLEQEGRKRGAEEKR
jgi:hypothetical protein